MGRKTLLSVLTLVITLTGHPPDARAATLNAASCTVADVQAAHTAASAGDTIQMPTCNVSTWNGTVTITKASITLKGTGQATTIIQRAAVEAQWDFNPMFQVNSSATNFVAQDFTLNGTQDTHPENCDIGGDGFVDVGIRLNGAVDFRIHHIHFAFLEVGVIAEGNPLTMRGVIDHNTFTDIHGVAGHDCWGYAAIVNGNGTYPALDLGTSQNVFLEDNTGLRMKGFIATNNGARAVARHNIGDEVGIPNSCFNTHGLGAFARGSRQIEIYDNVCNLAGGGQWGIDISGGDGVVFNNQIDTGYNADVVVWNGGNCTGTWPQQDQPREVYVWNNTTIPGGAAAVTSNNGCAVVQLNRDYFLTPRPGYTPYTYPHPLAQSPQSLAAPTNLHVVTP